MKYFLYLKYFIYIALNWNIRLAWFTISHEITGEKKYGINTTQMNDLKKLSITGRNLKNAQMYQGANYFLLELVFEKMHSMHSSTSFTDIGCGKGRALVVAAHHGFRQLTGVDFAKELCEAAERNTSPLHQKFPGLSVNIVCADAVDFTIEKDMDVLFFFNPFNEVVMGEVVKNIISSVHKHPRMLYVIYINPVHKDLFANAGFEEVFEVKKFRLIEGMILRKAPSDG